MHCFSIDWENLGEGPRTSIIYTANTLKYLHWKCLVKQVIISEEFTLRHFTYGLKIMLIHYNKLIMKYFLKTLSLLANGPDQFARKYKRYIIHGSKFCTKESKKNTMNYATVKDKRPCLGDVTYYGALKDVVEI
ncbi:hypothetical protein DVH24_026990 [Malus domestica]|uniref:Uncharacterized protein n=1 Tax=Malus domestica TaxID=3750 RepID=A0A498IRJ2_MALDO|nr:hypothetical protein DVH24_026990 [Malus domestica]